MEQGHKKHSTTMFLTTMMVKFHHHFSIYLLLQKTHIVSKQGKSSPMWTLCFIRNLNTIGWWCLPAIPLDSKPKQPQTTLVHQDFFVFIWTVSNSPILLICHLLFIELPSCNCLCFMLPVWKSGVLPHILYIWIWWSLCFLQTRF